jgi:L-ascorbate metabolism protein UlaG (beta-lactamase superfamily)
MGDPKVYLKQNVIAEPLINQWYAWSYLVSPATAPLYVANLHLKIMESFVAAPQVHAAAYKNPEMVGGPFINYDASKVNAVRELLEKTRKEQARMVQFAQAVESLDKMLAAEASGYSLEPLYEKVPEILRGYVELIYDLDNNPSFRFIEGLLYKSEYYDPTSQSMALSLINGDYRPFVFSTPRLEMDKSLHIKLPFNAQAIDELFAMKRVPQQFSYIQEALNVPDSDQELLRSFFSEEVPPVRPSYAGDGVRIRYIAHACVLIESNKTSILTDPVISYSYASEIERNTFADLPEHIDYIVITHNHQDHCMFETLLQLRHKTGTVIVPRSSGGRADPSLKRILQSIGFVDVREIDEVESIAIPDGSITSMPFLGEHCDLSIRTKTAYLVDLKGKSMLFGADSCNIEPQLYDHIHRLFGDLDVLFLGMECDGAPLTWMYGPLLTRAVPRKIDQSRKLNGSNFAQALDLVSRSGAKQVYVYAMGLEPWLIYLTSLLYTDESLPMVESSRLVEACLDRGLAAERLFCQKEIHLSHAQ